MKSIYIALLLLLSVVVSLISISTVAAYSHSRSSGNNEYITYSTYLGGRATNRRAQRKKLLRRKAIRSSYKIKKLKKVKRGKKYHKKGKKKVKRVKINVKNQCTKFCKRLFGTKVCFGSNKCQKQSKHGKGLCFECGPAAPTPHPDACKVGSRRAHCCSSETPTCCKNSVCTNVQNDLSNCGTCNNQCNVTTDACCSGNCTNIQSDVNNCGSCGNDCPTGQSCCSGNCSSLNTVQNCGRCGNECSPPQSVCGRLFFTPGTPSCCAPPLQFGCTFDNFVSFCCSEGGTTSCVLNGQPVGFCFI